jgi:hypothetical protein
MDASSVYGLPREVRHRIPDWKKEYRYVYAVSIDTSWDTPATCVFRVLTRDEMRYVEEASAYRDEWWAEGWVIGHCLLYPHAGELDDWLAGAVDVLGDSILEASGWASAPAIEETLAAARQQTGTLDSAMVSYILKAFPSMKAEDLGRLQFIDLIGYLAQAEVILGEQLQTDMWLNPRRYERSLRRARKRQINRPFIPGQLGPAEGFDTPAEAMFSKADLKKKPQLSHLREAMDEDTLLAADSGTKLTSGEAIMEEMMAQRDFLQGGIE